MMSILNGASSPVLSQWCSVPGFLTTGTSVASDWLGERLHYC